MGNQVNFLTSGISEEEVIHYKRGGEKDPNFLNSTSMSDEIFELEPSVVIPGTNTFLCKVVLLGAGFSGKSTLFYQFQRQRGNITTMMTKMFAWKVRLATLDVAYEVIQIYKSQVGENFELPYELKEIDEYMDGRQAFTRIMAESWKILQPKVMLLPRIWEYEEMKTCLALYPSDVGVEHFTKPENLERIWDELYRPSVDDILLNRTKKMGLTSVKFMGKFLYQMVDTGGQRNERKKWGNSNFERSSNF
jgi:GTPase SAR1 family protein